jgi:hypothetical protein
MLALEWGWIAELLEGAVDVIRYGDVNASFILMPIRFEAGPIDSVFVVRLEGIDDMQSVWFGEILDSEIVDTEDERGAFGAVALESWCRRE